MNRQHRTDLKGPVRSTAWKQRLVDLEQTGSPISASDKSRFREDFLAAAQHASAHARSPRPVWLTPTRWAVAGALVLVAAAFCWPLLKPAPVVASSITGLQGCVINAADLEPIAAVNVWDLQAKKILTSSNATGFFSLSYAPGNDAGLRLGAQRH